MNKLVNGTKVKFKDKHTEGIGIIIGSSKERGFDYEIRPLSGLNPYFYQNDNGVLTRLFNVDSLEIFIDELDLLKKELETQKVSLQNLSLILMNGGGFDLIDHLLLEEQYSIIEDYILILEVRIERYPTQ